MLAQSLLRELLCYYPESGIFIWRANRKGGMKKGMIAGWVNSSGYVEIHFCGKKYVAHKLAWLYVYGHYPKMLDHINTNRTDNRIDNLRECTYKQNAQNTGLRSNNTSGFKGVRWNKQKLKWIAKIKVDGETLHLGCFNSIEDAIKAYDDAARHYFREFARTNRDLKDGG